MSYVRWGEDGSSVYVYADVAGYITCCACPFETRETEPWVNSFGQTMTFETGNAELRSAAEVVAHMRQHRENGDTVPDYLFDENLYEPEDFQPYQPPAQSSAPEPASNKFGKKDNPWL